METETKKGALVLAAGSGVRYGERKQDVLFHGKPLWVCVLDTLQQVIPRERIVVVGKDIAGGQTRTESVKRGLRALPDDTDKVLIAEAARPLLTAEQVNGLLDRDEKSITFVRALVNTVIYRDGTYIDREKCYELLTPQAFDYALLLEAYQKGDFSDMTDETRVMYEYHGIKPVFIETENNLYKVTYPGDLDILESIYRRLSVGKETRS
jgi:2-C-methyl-D-erythritol 4-phosphate cytidylyltransferase